VRSPLPLELKHVAERDDERELDRSIGDLIRELRKLSDAQIERILAYQRRHGVRFGEAAVALELASRDDVMWALSRQFQYAYASRDDSGLNPELVAAIDPFNSQTEAFRSIRSQLMMGPMGAEGPKRALAMLSPNVGDGKSFFAANLAIVFSQLGAKTLLVDADMRSPRQHELFGISNEIGLSSVLSGRAGSSVVRPAPELPSLFVMPVGAAPPNPLELLQRPAFGLLMQDLLAEFDHVIVDTPSATFGSDARVLASKCGVAMVVARRHVSGMKEVHKLVSQLAVGAVQFAGVAVNDH